MAKTTAELVRAALEELQAVGGGQDASSSDSDTVTSWVAVVVADLKARNIIDIPNANAIDDAVFGWLVKLVAEWAAPAFGRATDHGRVGLYESRLMTLARIGGAHSHELSIDPALQRRGFAGWNIRS
jgi:hypothetical protein